MSDEISMSIFLYRYKDLLDIYHYGVVKHCACIWDREIDVQCLS